MYTNTPDLHFVISLHPDHPQAAIACGFSGHSYKFCSVVGEILADLAMDGTTSHHIDLFSPARLRKEPTREVNERDPRRRGASLPSVDLVGSIRERALNSRG